jgi:hypothetical protein
MKYFPFLLYVTVCVTATAQNALVPDESVPIPKLTIDGKGELIIQPSASSSPNDFDFLVGKWRLKHRKLKSRLTNSNTWEEFETVVEDFKILEGMGNMDVGRAIIDGKPWEGRTLRLFDPKTRLWSLYWLSSNAEGMDPPVVGSFENGVGHFFGKDVFNGKNIVVLFRWDARDKDHSKWSQAFSPDNGKTWEWNWFNVKEKILAPSLKEVVETNDRIPIPNVNFDKKGDLIIEPSATSAPEDFNFLVGSWKLYHRKLKGRLVNSNEWEEFETIVKDYSILEGRGNMDVGNAVIDGKPWEGRTFRVFNPKTRLWSLYWVASNVGTLDPPVVGSFENGVGHFFCKDVYNGKNVIVLFRWNMKDKDYPVWSQAFSADNGKTWEWNWYNISHRIN